MSIQIVTIFSYNVKFSNITILNLVTSIFSHIMSCRLYVSSKGIHRSDINSHYFNLSCQPYGEGEEYFYIRVSSSGAHEGVDDDVYRSSPWLINQ